MITIGIPAYGNVPAETMEDYMRFAFHCGRLSDYDFTLAVKIKTEQFRARNAIVKSALQIGADYILMLDDDHVIDWEITNAPSDRYDFITKMIKHMENDPQMGIVGALYYHRGGECKPVMMKEGSDGQYYGLDYGEVEHKLQKVDVTGGGCFLLRASMFDKLKEPWFAPEFQYGTDIQICRKAKEAGYTVWCDTSIELGHVLNKRDIVTPKNYLKIKYENMPKGMMIQDEVTKAQEWDNTGALNLYFNDVVEYIGVSDEELGNMVLHYSLRMHEDFDKYEKEGNLEEYYRTRGKEQLARHCWYHHQDHVKPIDNWILAKMGTTNSWKIIDFGCGSSPVGFELALRGHKVDFVDIDGSGAYEFVKWRAKKYALNGNIGWSPSQDYDVIMFLDVIEHLPNFKQIEDLIPRLKVGGIILTNFFILNPEDMQKGEHINWDRDGLKKLFLDNGIYPLDRLVWTKRNI